MFEGQRSVAEDDEVLHLRHGEASLNLLLLGNLQRSPTHLLNQPHNLLSVGEETASENCIDGLGEAVIAELVGAEWWEE